MGQPSPLWPEPRPPSHLNQILTGSRLVCCLPTRQLIRLLSGPLPQPDLLLGAATTLSAGLDLVHRLGPELLLVGEQLDQGSGFELVLGCRRQSPLATVLVMERPPEPLTWKALQRAGVVGVLQEAMLRPQPESDPAGGPRPPLTARELDVLRWAAIGERNWEIAARLQLAPETIKSHLSSLIRKLGARDRTHACVLALARGLIERPQGETRST